MPKDQFLAITLRQFSDLKSRYKRKKLPPPPFDMIAYRIHVRKALGPHGVIQCRYCHGWFGIESIVGDHRDPLSRGGGLGLENIEFICAGDNNKKGSLTDAEYDSLLLYCDNIHPFARKDILGRLQIATKLAAGSAWRYRKSKNVHRSQEEAF